MQPASRNSLIHPPQVLSSSNVVIETGNSFLKLFSEAGVSLKTKTLVKALARPRGALQHVLSMSTLSAIFGTPKIAHVSLFGENGGTQKDTASDHFNTN